MLKERRITEAKCILIGAIFAMSSSVSFVEFRKHFFDLFTGKSFRGGDYLNYLQRSTNSRGGDEASIVDMAVVSQLPGLLGFEPAERVY
ncbi:MAG: hypothetical protein ACRDHW_05865, partial [Ktedonobacteraceae bacterium]